MDNLIGVVLTLALAFAVGLGVWWFTADQRDRTALQHRLDTWPVIGSLVNTPSSPISNLPDDNGGGGSGGGGGGPRTQQAPGNGQLGGDDSGGYPLK